MKKVLGIVGVLALIGICGCEVSSPRGGGMSTADSFRILVPRADRIMKQGEIGTVDLSLARGDNFKRDVKVDIRSSEKGVTVDPTSFTVKASAEATAMFHITVAKDAPLGDYRLTLVGTPSSGEPTTAVINVKVITP